MEKLTQFIEKVRSANGPAQIVGYSLWGVILAGMLWDFDPTQLHQELLGLWGAVSLAVLLAAIWGSKRLLQYVLVFDMVLSMIVLSIYSMYEPTYATQLIYQVDTAGNFLKIENDVSCIFTHIAIIWSVFHSAYLANLTQRQILESRRFNSGL